MKVLARGPHVGLTNFGILIIENLDGDTKDKPVTFHQISLSSRSPSRVLTPSLMLSLFSFSFFLLLLEHCLPNVAGGWNTYKVRPQKTSMISLMSKGATLFFHANVSHNCRLTCRSPKKTNGFRERNEGRKKTTTSIGWIDTSLSTIRYIAWSLTNMDNLHKQLI